LKTNNTRLYIKFIQRAFIDDPRLKTVSIIVVLVLLLASGYGIWKAYTMPLAWEEPITLVNYEHQGEFDYQVFIRPGHIFSPPPIELPKVEPNEEEEERPQYFLNLIEYMEIGFDYVFTPDYPCRFTSSDVYIVAILEGPSGWQKEVPLKSRSGDEYLTTSFLLELEDFEEIIDEVEEELLEDDDDEEEYTEPEEYIYDLVIEARVKVSTFTGEEWVDDTFVQPLEISVGGDTIEWDTELNLSERRCYWGRYGGFSYKHTGNFSYTIWLDEDKTALYGVGVSELSPEPYWPPLVISRSPGEVYFPRLIDIMKSSFSYSFICDQPVTDLVEEVEVTAILKYPEIEAIPGYPEVWQKTFTLVPETQESGGFVLEFPVDINYFSRLTEVIREEIGMGAPTHDLTINAEVHTRAVTQFGPIDEVFTHTLRGALGTTTITWDKEVEKSEAATIAGTKIVTDPDVPKYRLWSRIAAAVLLVIFLFVTWHAIWARPVMSKIAQEAFRAKKKHRNVIVDIAKLPAAQREQVVIPVGSLEELIKVADNLLKPVLHQAGADKHTYCVIDGLTRYEYISKLWHPANKGPTEDERFQT
jgi:hypothetical protein